MSETSSIKPSLDIRGGYDLTILRSPGSNGDQRDEVALAYALRIPADEKGGGDYQLGTLCRFDESGKYLSVEEEFAVNDRISRVQTIGAFVRAGLSGPFAARYWTASLGARGTVNPLPASFPELQLYLAGLLHFMREDAGLRLEAGIGFDIPLE